MNKVLIMLSTYNGEKFLREQLDSIYAQEGVEIHILVRDDGSKDSTIDILSEYQQKFGNMTIHADENVGAAMSFHYLMAYAYEGFLNYDYFAFSDQDDVWFDDKLSVAVKQLSGGSGDIYYCNALVTDANLNKMAKLGCEHNLSFQYLMFRQPALGCTQVMTKGYFKFCTEVFKRYLNENPPYIYLHDVWTMWISQMVGANVIVDNDCYILYRQHGNNVTSHKAEAIWLKIIRVLKRAKKRKGYASINFKILSRLLDKDLVPEVADVLIRLNEYKKTLAKTCSFAFYMQGYFKSYSIKAKVMFLILCRLY